MQLFFFRKKNDKFTKYKLFNFLNKNRFYLSRIVVFICEINFQRNRATRKRIIIIIRAQKRRIRTR